MKQKKDCCPCDKHRGFQFNSTHGVTDQLHVPATLSPLRIQWMPRSHYPGGRGRGRLLNNQRPQTQHADVCIFQKVLRMLPTCRATQRLGFPLLLSSHNLDVNVCIELLAGKFIKTYNSATIRSRIFYFTVGYPKTQVL